MKKSVRITLTQDEYNQLLALKNYLGCKSLVETVSFAVEKEINRHQGNSIYLYYLEEARKGKNNDWIKRPEKRLVKRPKSWR